MTDETKNTKRTREYDATAKAKSEGLANPAAVRADAALRAEIAGTYGEPFLFRENQKGELRLAKVRELPLAALYAAKSEGILYEIEEARLYSYWPDSGLWRPRSPEENLVDIAAFMLAESRRPGLEELEAKRSISQERTIQEYAKGLPDVAKRGVFAFKPEARNRVIHLANGTVPITDNKLGKFRAEFRRKDYSRNQIPVPFDPAATCPRFIEELLSPSLAEATRAEDLDLLSMFFGLFVLGINLPQKMLILDGAAGSGKSTLAKIGGLLVGEDSRMMLRTDQLGQRFELSAFVGRTLLMAADVKARFLLEPGALMLKSLVGGDMLHAETKHGQDRVPIRGCFNCMITANAQLRVKIESDRGAWRRRLAIVTFQEHTPERKIVDFENVIFREEKSGILNWALAGLDRLLIALDETGDMPLSPAQVARIEELLAQSEALESFLRDRIEKAEGCKLTKGEIRERFWDYCRESHWDLPSKNEIGSALPAAMKRLFGVSESHSVPDGAKQVYGYVGVGWRDVRD